MGVIRFGAIGGTGWLGSALVAAALKQGVIDESATTVSTRSGKRGSLSGFPAITFTADNQALVMGADVILLTVRPQDLGALSLDLSGKLVLSVMAMVPVAALEARFGKARFIRAMPNAAAERGLSFTPLLVGETVTQADLAFARTFFTASGEVEEVRDEALLDYFTGLTGSGPAFFANLAVAMERDAVKRGLPPETASRAVKQLVKGAVSSLTADQTTMQGLVDTFLEYQGTTAAGLKAMETAGLEPMVRAMLAAAEAKAATGL